MNRDITTIKRRQGRSEFEQLRADMLQAVQDLSAHRWTDYNLHDPGVTILEQLCYALTDINYRSEHDIKALLADSNNTIDLKKQGLFTPQEALPNRPVSILDLQKLLLDRIPELAYVDISMLQDKQKNCGGLYNIRLKPYLHSANKNIIIEQVYQYFHEVRNLCENINALSFIKDKTCSLYGDIFIEDDCNPADILSKIYGLSERFLLGEVYRDVNSANQIRHDEDDKNLLNYKDGPRLFRHVIQDEDIAAAHYPRPISELIAKLINIPGVISISHLSITVDDEDRGKIYYDHMLPAINDCNLRLSVPCDQAQVGLNLIQKGQSLRVNIDEYQQVSQHFSSHRQYRLDDRSISADSQILKADPVNTSEYSSIQSQFPNNYGISALGVPAHYSNIRKAQAKQLKAYLSLFDQLLFDHLGILENIKEFFSVNLDDRRSYPGKPLSIDVISDFDQLCVNAPDENFLDDIFSENHHIERKQRVLDYLLAINGRDNELYGLEYRNTYLNQEEQQRHLLLKKQELLLNIHTLSGNRASGYNISKPSWNTQNISSLEKKLRLMLGVDVIRESLIKPLLIFDNPEEIDIKSDVEYLPSLFFKKNIKENSQYKFSEFVDLPSVVIDEEQAKKTFLILINYGLKQYKEMLLHYGCQQNCYRIGYLDNKKSIDLVLDISFANGNDSDEWIYIASFKRLREAIVAANHLRFMLQKVNFNMEGMHLIEHNLLLPFNKYMTTSKNNSIPKDFYQQQISIILPNWTLRFSDNSFKQYFEDLVRRECPAHIYPNVYWLDNLSLGKFENLFKAWSEEKQEGSFKDYKIKYREYKNGTKILTDLSIRLSKFLYMLQQTQPSSNNRQNQGAAHG